MGNAWDADIHINQALAQKLIRTQFPQLAPVSLVKFGEGWDNIAWLVNDRLVFRFPRRKLGVALLENEIRVLPELAAQLPLPVPNPQWVGKPTDEYPYFFAGYEMLVGRTACTAALSDVARASFAQPLGLFLKCLHGLSGQARAWNPPPDPFERTDIQVLRRKLTEGLDSLESHLDVGELQQARSFIMQPFRYQTWGDTLVHGDLYVRHLLVNDKLQLSGVIDWGDLHMGEATVDVAIAWSFLPRSAHETFLDAYGPVDDDSWAMARLRGLFHASALLRYGFDRQDTDLIREGRFILGNVL